MSAAHPQPGGGLHPGVVACFVFLLAGFPLVLDWFRGWAPQALVEAVASLSLPDALRVDRQGRDRRARPALLRDADRLFPASPPRSPSTCARRTRSDVMTKRSTLGGGAVAGARPAFVGLTVLCNYALRGWRLDLTQNRLYTIGAGHRPHPREHQGADQPLLLLLGEDRGAAAAAEVPTAMRVRESARGADSSAPTASSTCTSSIRSRSRGGGPRRRARRHRTAPVDAVGTKFYFGLAGTNSTDGHAGDPVLRSRIRSSSSSTTSPSSFISSPIRRSRWSPGCPPCP